MARVTNAQLQAQLETMAADADTVPLAVCEAGSGRAVGTLLSAAGDRALAYLRFDRTEDAPAGSLVAGMVGVTPER